jgi:hypothetical protein
MSDFVRHDGQNSHEIGIRRRAILQRDVAAKFPQHSGLNLGLFISQSSSGTVVQLGTIDKDVPLISLGRVLPHASRDVVREEDHVQLAEIRLDMRGARSNARVIRSRSATMPPLHASAR